MALRTLVALVFASVLIVACGPAPKTEKEICGPAGCDACVGLTCSRLPDGGVP